MTLRMLFASWIVGIEPDVDCTAVVFLWRYRATEEGLNSAGVLPCGSFKELVLRPPTNGEAENGGSTQQL